MLLPAIKSPKDAAMMNIVLADSVYTLATAHMCWGLEEAAAFVEQHRVDALHPRLPTHTHT